jgi:hypothetical protein
MFRLFNPTPNPALQRTAPCVLLMKPPLTTRFLATLLFCIFASTISFGRVTFSLSWSELFAQADVVVVIEALENVPAKDELPGDHGPQTNFDAINTRCKVLTAIKSATEAPKELTVLHFTYSKRVHGYTNGAEFIRFPIGRVEYERRELKDNKPTGAVENVQYQPSWLAFLKRRSDGRYAPVTGHYDATNSFKELRGVSGSIH